MTINIKRIAVAISLAIVLTLLSWAVSNFVAGLLLPWMLKHTRALSIAAPILLLAIAAFLYWKRKK